MKAYLIRRITLAFITYLVVATLVFVVFRLMPGDPTLTVLNPSLTPEVRQQMAEDFGLNQPMYIQYFVFMKNMLVFDFGVSFHHHEPVVDVLANRLPNTLIMMSIAILFAYSVGTPLGALSGWMRGSNFDNVTLVSLIIFRSAPVFFVGLVLLYVFSFQLEWLPIGHMIDSTNVYDSRLDMYLSLDFAQHIFLPIVSMVPLYLAYPALLMRTTLAQTRGEDYIKICNAKGVSKRNVFLKHALRNSLLPIISAVPIILGSAVAGSILIETIYSWPGISRALVRAILRNDFPLAQGAFLMVAMLVIAGNFLADLLYVKMDPRIQYE